MKRFSALLWLAVALCLTCLGGTNVIAGGPESVLLVVNADSPSSKMIANHYVALRKIPPSNVVYLNGIPPTESMDLDKFKELILKPVLETINERRLASHIDYIVYSADFPTAIQIPQHVKKLADKIEEGGVGFNRKLYLPTASINSLTFFAAAVLADNPGYLSLDANWYYRHSAELLLRQPFTGQLQNIYEHSVAALEGDDEELYLEAEKALLALAKTNPRQVAVAYRLVECYAKLGDKRKATDWLGRAIQTGWQYRQYTLDDPLLSDMQSDPLFSGVVKRVPDEPFEFAPTIAFKNRYQYSLNGMPNNYKGQGNRFYLSTVLAVTRNYGNTEQEALDQIERTVRADGTNPEGSFYFTTTEDVRTRTRKINYDFAVTRLRKMGYGAEVVSGILPTDKPRVLGVTIGSPEFNWKQSGSRFVPGAIGDNLTSYGGRMLYQSQTKFTEFLANGAAGGSGTVVEPYALQAKFPHPMIHVHYARGCTLAEAFYQSVAGPWQLLIVGDALCRPFGQVPDFGVTGVSLNQKVSGTIKLDPSQDENSVRIAGYQLFLDGQLIHIQVTEAAMPIDTTDLADGHHEFRIVAIADNLLETSSSAVIPLQVNNSGHKVTLTANSRNYLDTDVIEMNATSNIGDSIALLHNGRVIAKESGRKVTFRFDAALLGRGPIQLEAVAMSSVAVGEEQEEVQPVASQPFNLLVEGRISKRRKYENPPRKKRPTVIRSNSQRSGSARPPSGSGGPGGGRSGPPRSRPPR
ncbi:TIGR03790 family protein [Mariniblastus sp.]|nr:TIGR03790 family protein [Mariniblastus sp.]